MAKQCTTTRTKKAAVAKGPPAAPAKRTSRPAKAKSIPASLQNVAPIPAKAMVVNPLNVEVHRQPPLLTRKEASELKPTNAVSVGEQCDALASKCEGVLRTVSLVRGAVLFRETGASNLTLELALQQLEPLAALVTQLANSLKTHRYG